MDMLLLKENDENPDWMIVIMNSCNLQKYLDEKYVNKIMGNITNKSNNYMKDVIKHIFGAVEHQNNHFKVNEFNKSHFQFDMYCLDAMPNDKFEMKIMEVNRYCMEFGDSQKIGEKIIEWV